MITTKFSMCSLTCCVYYKAIL